MTTPDAKSLLWDRRPASGRGRKPSLSIDGIVAEAIALADSEGLSSLSMPRLAQRLDRGVMTLYRYIPGKDELLALMVDTCLGQPPSIPASPDWRPAVRDWALALRRVCLDHPWWITVSLSDRVVGPNETAWLETELELLRPLRQSPAITMNVALSVSSYVRGAVQPELPRNPGPRLGFADFPETHHRYPRVREVFGSPEFTSGEALRDFFGFGLERLLDGIAARFATDGDDKRTGW